MPKGSTPWSTRTIAEGGTDSPVGDLVPVPDSAQPVINAGFIDDSGKWQLAAAADDRAFTLQDPNQALASGANIYVDVDMLNHDILIFGILDSSGNNINVHLGWLLPASGFGPYEIFQTSPQPGIKGDNLWKVNEYPGHAGSSAGLLDYILNDTSEDLSATWQFYKIIGLRGATGSMKVENKEASDAGTISTAYLRLV